MKNLFFILITLLTLSSTSCKKWQHKYPEDTERSKDTPFERLTNKWWTLKSASINGIDYTDSVKELFGIYQIYFSQNLEQTTVGGLDFYLGTVKPEKESAFVSIWSFPDEASVSIGPFFGFSGLKNVNLVPCYLNNNFTVWSYTILKLNESEFKIRITTKDQDTTITNYFKTN